MAQRKPYTYSTQYGRKKIREEARKFNEENKEFADRVKLLAYIGIIAFIVIFALVMNFLVDLSIKTE